MRKLFLSLVALISLSGAIAYGNYTATQGAGTNFGSIVVSTVHYAQMLLCDSVAPSQCNTVDSSGAASQNITKLGSNAINTGAGATGTGTIRTVTASDDPLLTTASTCKAGTAPGTQTPVSTGAVTSIQCDLNGNVYVATASQYPTGAVPITASTTGTTAATTATLAASASIKTYICGFSIRANATAAATANSTVTGTITGTLNYTQWTAPLASGLGITEQVFMPCVPSSAINTAIAVISAAPGTGGVVSVSAWGYQL